MPAKSRGSGERALQRVVFAGQRRGQGLGAHRQGLGASGIERRECGGVPEQVQRRALLRGGLGQEHDPLAKSNAASPVRFGIAIPAARQ
jgi:hypothetical protein